MMLHHYGATLLEGRFLQRRQRFFIDLLPVGRGNPGLQMLSPLTVHCPNTGSMKSCLKEGAPILYSDSGNPARKLRYTAELIHSGAGWIGIHTGRINSLAEAIFRGGLLPGFEGYSEIQPEPRIREAGMRLDFLLSAPDGRKCYVEVKNVTYYDGRYLAFPDSRSKRAAHHVGKLGDFVQRGFRACLLFVASRPEGEAVRPASEIDGNFAAALGQVAGSGVEVRAVRVGYSREGVDFLGELPVIL